MTEEAVILAPPTTSLTLSMSDRRQRGGGPLPWLFVVLLAVATTSFFHSVHELPDHDVVESSSSHTSVIHASLQDFKQSPIKPTTIKQPQVERADASWDDPTWIDRVKEDPIPNPPLPNGNETFSACLLVMVSTMCFLHWMRRSISSSLPSF